MPETLNTTTIETMQRLEKMKQDFLSSATFKSIQGYLMYVQEVQKQLRPFAESAALVLAERKKSEEMYQNLFPETISIPYRRPVGELILDKLEELSNEKVFQKTNDEIRIGYNPEERSLERIIDGELFVYKFLVGGKREQLFEILYRQGGYVRTEKLWEALGYSNDNDVTTLSKVVQTLRKEAASKLHLNDIKLIENRGILGYRINPKILITRK